MEDSKQQEFIQNMEMVRTEMNDVIEAYYKSPPALKDGGGGGESGSFNGASLRPLDLKRFELRK